MNRVTFWHIAEETLSEVLTDLGYKSEVHKTICEMEDWLANENDEWGILFADNKGESGLFPVCVSNRLSAEEIKQEFKRQLLMRFRQ